MSRSVGVFLFLFAALAAGQAVHWFLGGAYMDHSEVRAALVVLQLLIAVAAMFWVAKKLRHSTDVSH